MIFWTLFWAVLLPFIPALCVKTYDFQIWNYDSITASLCEHVDLYVDLEWRFRDNAKRFYYNHAHVEFPIHVCSFLDIGPCYRQVFTRSTTSPHPWSTTSEPNINVILFWQWSDFLFSNRARVTYLIPDSDADNVYQFRNKLWIGRNLQKWRDLQLFADDEIFLEQKRNGIYENRTSAGINLKLFGRIRGEIGYRYRIMRHLGIWYHTNILLLNLMAQF
jgi:hypothetical protein